MHVRVVDYDVINDYCKYYVVVWT